MKTEIATLMVYKVVIFTCVLFQIDSTCMILAQLDPTAGMDIYKIVSNFGMSNFGIVGFLILAIKYFISESKRMQKEFAQERTEQEERHIHEKDKQLELHDKESQLQALRIEKLQEELIELRVKLGNNK